VDELDGISHRRHQVVIAGPHSLESGGQFHKLGVTLVLNDMLKPTAKELVTSFAATNSLAACRTWELIHKED
jgi:hypothetical protein